VNSATRNPSLDGWRALSIVIVMLSHFEFATGFPGSRCQPGERLFQGDHFAGLALAGLLQTEQPDRVLLQNQRPHFVFDVDLLEVR